MEKFQVLFIGNFYVGKTSLLITYNEGKFPEKNNELFYIDFSKKFQIKNREIEIEFEDSILPESYQEGVIEKYKINKANVISICFAIDNDHSFEDIETEWIPKIEENSSNPKIILIGTKIDLRNKLKEENQKLITKEEGIELAKKINAIKYFECSSLNQKGIETIFNEIALICVGKDRNEQNKQNEQNEQNEQEMNKKCILN
ncbi:rho-related gtp-binding protein rhog [Anaeramoeba ignava]|uniref:Rho-related gtp-binding protein rhog n=1 Tax=Anaeramoeba ignava TaxID=1746090 RepID=A0A9Q0RFB7_ANAIG|nr:rho-related gtp-binding protein rhog [Anaeramoeba ignava]